MHPSRLISPYFSALSHHADHSLTCASVKCRACADQPQGSCKIATHHVRMPPDNSMSPRTISLVTLTQSWHGSCRRIQRARISTAAAQPSGGASTSTVDAELEALAAKAPDALTGAMLEPNISNNTWVRIVASPVQTACRTMRTTAHLAVQAHVHV